jgi:hypothetical protein
VDEIDPASADSARPPSVDLVTVSRPDLIGYREEHHSRAHPADPQQERDALSLRIYEEISVVIWL